MAKFKAKNAEGEEIEVDIDLTPDNLPKELKDQIIKSAQGIAYGNVDTVADKFGFKKPEGIEKTSDFIEHILKTNKEQHEALQAQLEEAKKGNNQPEDVERLKTEITALKKITENQKKELEDKDRTYKETLLHAKMDSELSSLDIAVPSHLTEEADIRYYKEVQREVIKNKLLSTYELKEDEGGKGYRVLKGNEAEINDKNEMASIRDIAERDFKGWLAQPDKGGEGGGGAGKLKPDGRGKAYKTYEDIAAAADAKKLSVGSPEWTEFVTKTSEEAGIEI